MSTLGRYWLLQVPGWVLLVFALVFANERFDLPAWVGGLIALLWVVKDAVLYPILKPGYETATKTGLDRLIGLTGTTKDDLDPEGYVLVNGELWLAVVELGDEPIPKGADVRVDAAHGMMLTVSRVAGPGHK